MANACEDVLTPSLFANVRNSQILPNDVRIAQRTFNEVALYQAISRFAVNWYERTQRPPRVIDLCASTGMCAEYVTRAIPVSSVTLVDIDENALGEANGRRGSFLAPLRTVNADAAQFGEYGAFDLVLLNSAYHHIENVKKTAFLKNSRKLLSPTGRILLGDHFLSPYEDRRSYQYSVVAFYTSLLAELERRESSMEGVDIVRQAAFMCWLGREEFKVSWHHFVSDMEKACVVTEEIDVVWSPTHYHSGHGPVGSVAAEIRIT